MSRGIAILLAALLFLSGCASREEILPDTPSPPPTQSEEHSGELTVSTDWSKLDDADKPLPSVGSRWYDEYTGHLIVRDDYGPLIPYAGLRLMDDWPAITGCLYGLMTTDGVVVTDAVYSSVASPHYNMGMKQIPHPLLALRMVLRPDGEDGGYWKDYWAIAARDGSWCTEFCYRGMSAGKDGLLLFEDDRVTYMSPTGEIIKIWTMAGLGFTQEEIDSIFYGLQWGEGRFGEWYDGYFCLGWSNDTHKEVTLIHIPSGQKETMDFSAWDTLAQASIASQSGMEDNLTADLPPGNYDEINFLWDNFSDDDNPALISASQHDSGNYYDVFFLYDGTPLPEFTRRSGRWYYTVRPVGGLIEVLDLNTASYYDLKTMDCVFRTYLGYESD
jgi:hypothetical protein